MNSQVRINQENCNFVDDGRGIDMSGKYDSRFKSEEKEITVLIKDSIGGE